MKTCWNNSFIEELKLLKPDIIIPFWGKFFKYFDKESEIQSNESDETVFNLPPLIILIGITELFESGILGMMT